MVTSLGQFTGDEPGTNKGCRADTNQGCRADTKQVIFVDPIHQGCILSFPGGRAYTKQGCRAVQGCCPLEMAVAVVVAVEGVGSYHCASYTM